MVLTVAAAGVAATGAIIQPSQDSIERWGLKDDKIGAASYLPELPPVATFMTHCSPGTLVISLLLCLASVVQAGGVLPSIDSRFAAASAEGPYPETPDFQRHVVALLGRLGCNGRSCHGSFQGQGGFRLSMFGYDFSADHQAITGGDSPRVDLKTPADSLILRKPTSEDEHGGGRRYEPGGWEYRVLRSWIAGGAKHDVDRASRLLRLEVSPAEMLFSTAGQETQLRAVAVWSDGTREEVTCLTRFSSNDDTMAEVTPGGLVKSKGPGDTHIIATYDSAVTATPVLMPVSGQAGERYPEVPAPTKVDELIVGKLRKLGIVPADRCTDEEFLRRVSLDIAGTLPTPEQVRAFTADESPNKRAAKVEDLLATPAYSLWWSTKFCDITGLNAPLYLGSTDFGPIVGEQWRSWVERKFRDNVAYDKIVEGMVVAVSRPAGQKYDDFALAQSGYTLTKDPQDFTDRETMPHFWFRGNLATTDDKALAFAYSFMGVRLDCAQCHKHPFDRWSQQDFKQFAAIFDRVRWGVSPECQSDYDQLRETLGVPRMKNAAERRQSYWRWAREGKAVPWPEVFIAGAGDWQSGRGVTKRKDDSLAPKLLGGAEIDLDEVEDPRRPLMDWLRQRDNPYFAQAWVNRVWSHYIGRGIVEPADDLNLANPPSNRELLDYLTQAFVEHEYDMKWLHREITASRAYQMSWRTNDTNRDDERNFSHARIRRLPAEVSVDAMRQATASSRQAATYLTMVKDRKIGVQATADHTRTEFALAVFGKPLRTVNCDCEREQEPSLAQSLFVRNDQDLFAMLDRRDGWLADLAKHKSIDDPARRGELVREAYSRTLSREPNAEELARSVEHLSRTNDTRSQLRDLLWALLNTHEFITNH